MDWSLKFEAVVATLHVKAAELISISKHLTDVITIEEMNDEGDVRQSLNADDKGMMMKSGIMTTRYNNTKQNSQKTSKKAQNSTNTKSTAIPSNEKASKS